MLTKLKLIFNEDEANAVTVDLNPVSEKQTFPINPARKCQSIALVPEWTEVAGKGPVIGVDNLWIRVKRPKEYVDTVVPLLNIGALAKYRMGKGGIILKQVKVQATESNPVNAEKKQTIVATLLRNLGAAFAAERLLVAGAKLNYQPVPLDAKCNQYLTADKGWIKGQPDLGHFPIGEQKLAGVPYGIPAVLGITSGNGAE
jgi:hypothetical protein